MLTGEKRLSKNGTGDIWSEPEPRCLTCWALSVSFPCWECHAFYTKTTCQWMWASQPHQGTCCLPKPEKRRRDIFFSKHFINVLFGWKHRAAVALLVVQRAWGYRLRHETWNWYHVIDVAPNKPTNTATSFHSDIQRRCSELIRVVCVPKNPPNRLSLYS